MQLSPFRSQHSRPWLPRSVDELVTGGGDSDPRPSEDRDGLGTRQGGQALMALSIDSPASPELVKQVHSEFDDARFISLE